MSTGNVFDLVRDTPGDMMDKADAMSAPSTASQTSAPPSSPAPSPKPIVRSTTNPDNNLPDTEGTFHKVVRRFKGDPVGTKEW